MGLAESANAPGLAAGLARCTGYCRPSVAFARMRRTAPRGRPRSERVQRCTLLRLLCDWPDAPSPSLAHWRRWRPAGRRTWCGWLAGRKHWDFLPMLRLVRGLGTLHGILPAVGRGAGSWLGVSIGRIFQCPRLRPAACDQRMRHPAQSRDGPVRLVGPAFERRHDRAAGWR